MSNILKLIVIGDSTVGKTALLVKFVEGNYTSTATTIGIDFKCKDIQINGQNYKMQIWDTAGQERFQTISVTYFRRAHGVALLYDITNTQSFEHVPTWLESVAQNAQKKIPIILIGNKCDLEPNVPVEQGRKMAEANGIPFFLTSAKNGDGVEEAFTKLAEMVVGQKNEDNKVNKDEHHNEVVITDDDDEKKGKKKGCC